MGYGTADPLEAVLAPEYFALARGLLRAGELIYVRACPPTRRGSRAEAGERRMALVMVEADAQGAERAAGPVCLTRIGRHRLARRAHYCTSAERSSI